MIKSILPNALMLYGVQAEADFFSSGETGHAIEAHHTENGNHDRGR